nr:hypothetical protein CFP56_67622 [Quercus suber]
MLGRCSLHEHKEIQKKRRVTLNSGRRCSGFDVPSHIDGSCLRYAAPRVPVLLFQGGDLSMDPIPKFPLLLLFSHSSDFLANLKLYKSALSSIIESFLIVKAVAALPANNIAKLEKLQRPPTTAQPLHPILPGSHTCYVEVFTELYPRRRRFVGHVTFVRLELPGPLRFTTVQRSARLHKPLACPRNYRLRRSTSVRMAQPDPSRCAESGVRHDVALFSTNRDHTSFKNRGHASPDAMSGWKGKGTHVGFNVPRHDRARGEQGSLVDNRCSIMLCSHEACLELWVEGPFVDWALERVVTILLVSF